MQEQLEKDSSTDSRNELLLYGPPQYDSQRHDEERSVYGSPQHEVTDAKTSSSTDSEFRLRAWLFP